MQGEGFKRHFKKFIEISIDVVETFTTEHDFDFYFFVEKLHIFLKIIFYILLKPSLKVCGEY